MINSCDLPRKRLWEVCILCCVCIVYIVCMLRVMSCMLCYVYRVCVVCEEKEETHRETINHTRTHTKKGVSTSTLDT